MTKTELAADRNRWVFLVLGIRHSLVILISAFAISVAAEGRTLR